MYKIMIVEDDIEIREELKILLQNNGYEVKVTTNFENVEKYLQEAEENLNLAHSSQTKILSQEAAGEDLDIGFIFIHGQDHLMTTLLLKEVVQDFVELYKRTK